MAQHNLRTTGAMVSAGVTAAEISPEFRAEYESGMALYAPLIPNANLKMPAMSLFSIAITSTYEIEYDAEYVRFREFARAPSRFSSLYAFGSQEDCEAASRLYQWPLEAVRSFELVPHSLNRVRRVNMEIVSLMRTAYRLASWSREQRDATWRHYWSGGGEYSIEVPVLQHGAVVRRQLSSGVIWEYLIEGRLDLVAS